MPEETSKNQRPVARFVGLALVILLNVVAVLLAIIFLSEFVLVDRFSSVQDEEHHEEATADELVKRGYYPPTVEVDPYKRFEVLDRHPIYGWFWQPDEAGGLAQSNGAVTIDQDGFRATDGEVQRAVAAGRPLAFLLGGSAAFGYRSSRDSTTITGYLIDLQDAFHFVNAGVPGWDAEQELLRLKHQIVPLSPGLVISYTLFNDIERTIEGLEEADGTLQSFAFWLVPKTSHLVFSFLHERWPALGVWDKPTPTQAMLEAAIDSQVDRFIRNQEGMLDLARRHGFRFVTVIQPMTMTHDNVTIKGPHPDLYRRAVRRALGSAYCAKNCLDYSAMFDRSFDQIPVFFEDYVGPALERSVDLKTVIFADQCHLLDAGNEIVARRLMSDLGIPPAKR